jgi:hypothetical protein
MSKLSRKLVLSRETLVPLTGDNLDQVNGGATPGGPQGSGYVCSDCMSVRCSRPSISNASNPTSRPGQSLPPSLVGASK